MARKLKSDKVLFIATLLLVALSVVMVYSASAPMALDRYGRATRFLTTQAMWAVLGIAMLTVVMRIDYRYYREPMFIWTGLAFVGFALVAVYFRAPVNGARRWFGVGGIGVQPSELAKLVAIFSSSRRCSSGACTASTRSRIRCCRSASSCSDWWR